MGVWNMKVKSLTKKTLTLILVFSMFVSFASIFQPVLALDPEGTIYSKVSGTSGSNLLEYGNTHFGQYWWAFGNVIALNDSYQITKVSFDLQRYGTPTVNMYAKIYQINHAYSSGAVAVDDTMQPIGQSAPINASGLSSGSFALVNFTFATPPLLSPSIEYGFTIEVSNASEGGIIDSATNYVGVQNDNIPYHSLYDGANNQNDYSLFWGPLNEYNYIIYGMVVPLIVLDTTLTVTNQYVNTAFTGSITFTVTHSATPYNYLVSTNNTGTWTNGTWTSFSSSPITFADTWNNTCATVSQYKIYANTTDGIITSSQVFSFYVGIQVDLSVAYTGANALSSPYIGVSMNFALTTGSFILQNVTALLYRGGNANSTTAYFALYNMTGTAGTNGTPIGSPLAVTNAINTTASLPTTLGYVTFNFNTSYTLTTGNSYAIAFMSGSDVNYGTGNFVYGTIQTQAHLWADTSRNNAGTWDTTVATSRSWGVMLFGTSVYTVTASNDANSVIVPSGVTNFNSGDNQQYLYSANFGYAIGSVLVDGVSLNLTSYGGNYTFTNIVASHTIAVTSYPYHSTGTITKVQGPITNSVAGSDHVVVTVAPTAIGNMLILTFTGYGGGGAIDPQVTAVSGGGVSTWIKAVQLSESTVTGNHIISSDIWYGIVTIPGVSITVTFGQFPNSYGVATISEYYGVLSLDKTSSFWSIPGTQSTTSNTGTTSQLTIANELLIGVVGTYNSGITFSAPTNGFNITEQHSNGASLEAISIDTTGKSVQTTLTPTNYWTSCIATFKARNTYTIYTVPDAHSVFTPSGDITVFEGENLDVLVAATTGYYLTSVLVDSIDQGTISNYNFLNIVADHIIEATSSLTPRTPDTLNIGNFWTFLYAGNLLGFFRAIYVSAFGLEDVLYACLVLLFIIPVYLRTKSLWLICVLWVMLGGFALALMPVVSPFALVFLALGIGGILYKLVRSRY
jgi:hypothetical protein